MANQYLSYSDPFYFQYADGRFLSFVIKGPGCWSWSGGKYVAGYGKFSYMGKDITAHRYSWIMYFGPIPDGMCVLHKCDNRECTNPDHLFLGSHQDNMADKDRKGRGNYPAGERVAASKLVAGDIREIRRLRTLDSDHWTHERLGEMFGVSQSNISYILSGKTWSHVS